eukprot:scaffold24163_cov51-Isochrysis_galbana.AAC.1
MAVRDVLDLSEAPVPRRRAAYATAVAPPPRARSSVAGQFCCVGAFCFSGQFCCAWAGGGVRRVGGEQRGEEAGREGAEVGRARVGGGEQIEALEECLLGFPRPHRQRRHHTRNHSPVKGAGVNGAGGNGAGGNGAGVNGAGGNGAGGNSARVNGAGVNGAGVNGAFTPRRYPSDPGRGWPVYPRAPAGSLLWRRPRRRAPLIAPPPTGIWAVGCGVTLSAVRRRPL